jgi:DNA gyrase subunit A
MGRTASGVRGISLKDDSDEVIGMVAVDKDAKRFASFSSN